MKSRKTTYLDWSTFNKLLSTIKNRKVGLLFAMQGYCGLRVGDVLSLRWVDVMDKKQIDITEQKTGKKRTVYLNDVIINMINDKYKGQDGSVYIFKNKYSNTPISIEYVNRELKRIFIDNKIPYEGNVSSHLFRKTFGRRVMDKDDWSDKALLMLNEIYGHATIATTKIYLGIREEEIKNVYHSLV